MTALHKTVISIGIVVALVPVLGFSTELENGFLVVAGVVLIVLMLGDVWRMYARQGRTEDEKESLETRDEAIDEADQAEEDRHVARVSDVRRPVHRDEHDDHDESEVADEVDDQDMDDDEVETDNEDDEAKTS